MTTLAEWAEQVRRANGGLLTPHALVEHARDPSSPGHSHFEWRDDVAADAWRIEQARRLIRTIRIEYKPTPKSDTRSVRAYWADRTEPVGYRRTEDLAADPVGREVMLAEMAREWKALKRRYEHMAEFVEMVLRDVSTSEAA